MTLFQVTTNERISQAYDLHDQGLADSAIVVLQQVDSEPKDSAYYVAKNLEAWIYMDAGDRESLQKGFEILNLEIDSNTYPLTKSRMLSLRGYISQAWGDMESYRADQEASYKLSKEIGDTLGMSLALRNVYYYYSELRQNKKEVAWFVREMKAMPGDSTHQLRTIFVESYYEYLYGSEKKAIKLIADAWRLVPTGNEQWIMDVAFAQATFLIADRNLTLAEQKLVDLLEADELDLSWSAQYRVLARLVQIYMLTDRKALAGKALDKMAAMPSNSIDMYSIEIGAYAKMAYAGYKNAVEMDPVFNGVKKSGINDWQLALLVLAGAGILCGLLFGFARKEMVNPGLPSSRDTWLKFD
ncbi:MAG TPA: hypothetical protein DEQ34_13355 [Balneolaceae bacterium]|nr:hypothetical protein [Balneolaceae bacterium]